MFNLNFILLSAKVNLISEKQGCKKNALVAHGIGRFEIVFALSSKVVALHVRAITVQVSFPGLKIRILGYGVCFTIFLVFNKQF